MNKNVDIIKIKRDKKKQINELLSKTIIEPTLQVMNDFRRSKIFHREDAIIRRQLITDYRRL